ncbi:hypothetical protein ZWY2020_018396 [Hordeum vulgare]|nr:hypothetical protein ZWY2020_018396 [Hordeum vulgare]
MPRGLYERTPFLPASPPPPKKSQPPSPPPPPRSTLPTSAVTADFPSPRRIASSTVEICRASPCARLPYTVERHHAVRRPAPRRPFSRVSLLSACVGNSVLTADSLLVLSAGNLLCYLNRRQELQPARAELHQRVCYLSRQEPGS